MHTTGTPARASSLLRADTSDRGLETAPEERASAQPQRCAGKLTDRGPRSRKFRRRVEGLGRESGDEQLPRLRGTIGTRAGGRPAGADDDVRVGPIPKRSRSWRAARPVGLGPVDRLDGMEEGARFEPRRGLIRSRFTVRIVPCRIDMSTFASPPSAAGPMCPMFLSPSRWGSSLVRAVRAAVPPPLMGSCRRLVPVA